MCDGSDDSILSLINCNGFFSRRVVSIIVLSIVGAHPGSPIGIS